MKKLLTALLAVGMLLAMTACTEKPDPAILTTEAPGPANAAESRPVRKDTLPVITDPVVPFPEDTMGAPAPTVPLVSSAAKPVPSSDAALTPGELAVLQALFGNLNPPSSTTWYSQALTSLFDSPEDVDFRELFYNGNVEDKVLHPENFVPVSEEERSLLIAMHGADDFRFSLDCTPISRTEMEQALMMLFGLTVDQTNQIRLEDFDYLPETDRYFLFHGDTNAILVTLLDGLWLDENTVELHYLGGFNEVCTVVMERRDDHWYILSNESSFDYDSLWETEPTEETE